MENEIEGYGEDSLDWVNEEKHPQNTILVMTVWVFSCSHSRTSNNSIFDWNKVNCTFTNNQKGDVQTKCVLSRSSVWV